jgi:four helix bundle protein
MAITRFEDLLCWQEARILVNTVFDLCEKEPLSKDFGTKDQIRRAAISVMNNIAEGFGRHRRRQFLVFLDYSTASCMEVRSMSYVLLDRKYIDKEEFEKLYTQTITCTNLNIGLIKKLERDEAGSTR